MILMILCLCTCMHVLARAQDQIIPYFFTRTSHFLLLIFYFLLLISYLLLPRLYVDNNYSSSLNMRLVFGIVGGTG